MMINLNDTQVFFVDLRVFSVQKTGFLPKTGYFRKNVKSLISLWQPPFTPFRKYQVISQRLTSFLTNRKTESTKTSVFFHLIVFLFLNGFFPSRKPTPSKFMYVRAVLGIFLGPLFLWLYFDRFFVSGLAPEARWTKKMHQEKNKLHMVIFLILVQKI